MAPPSDEDGNIRNRFDDLCLDLNLEKSTIDEAWEAYQRISLNYTLEGDDLHWLACALYVSCRKSIIPTVGGREMMEGNCVSLTRLLRSSKLSVIQFFNKMKKWSDMANLPQKFRDKVDRLERNFNVSCVIFKKYQPIFVEIFKDPTKEQPRVPRGRKQRRLNCTVSDIFRFCWTLFVQVKGNFPAISDDLVNSYHLLLCCVDLVFTNALLANRRDLLNIAFEGLPENYQNSDYRVPAQAPCIIEKLCLLHDGLVIEAKGIKEHWWKPYIKKLFEKKSLKGNAEKLSGMIDSVYFETNSKNINKTYEEYVLTVGDFDERIFLGEDANQEIGTPAKAGTVPQTGSFGDKMKAKGSLKLRFDQTKSLAPHTPLTGRKYLKEKEHAVTPVSTATQSVSRLQALLTGLKTCPSETLKAIFAECSNNPTQSITDRIKQMAETFCQKFVESSDMHPGSHVDFAKMRLKLAETLYYKVMESIMTGEKKRLQGKKNIGIITATLGSLLEHDIFHTSLFACCLEVVIFSYNSQRIFPWIIDIFDIPAFHFYKVIELILRAEDGLSRDVVKHLNTVEEAVLQECAWQSSSPLWEVIRDSNGGGVPTCEDVTLPSQMDNGQTTSNSHPPPPQIGSPMQHPRIRALTGVEPPKRDPITGSPVSAHDRFSSPTPGSAKRRLFSPEPNQSTSPTNSSTSIHIGQIVNVGKTNQTQEKIVTVEVQTVNNKDGTIHLIASPIKIGESSHFRSMITTSPISQAPTNVASEKPAAQPTTDSAAKKPRRTGSVGLFFRKLYHLANVRLLDLCSRLQIDDDLRRKIWTCLVHAIVHHSDLMKDRHLDQLLMCSIYVICKVTRNDRQFQEIMRCYRMQPQAQSHVYRSVLLSGRQRCSSSASVTSHNGSSNNSSPEADKHKGGPFGHAVARSASTMPASLPNSAPPTPTRMAGTASSFEDEERGDLIKYYNSVFVTRVQPFALRFSPADNDENGLTAHPILSPLPIVRTHQVSPRKVSNRHQLYISPRKDCIPMSPGNSLVFLINKSPSKDLKEINSMIKTERNTKRAMDFEESPQKRICTEKSNGNFLRKLHIIKNDRDVAE